MIAFVSGHLDLTQEEFEQHYCDQINDAITLHHTFVIGDAAGADKMAQYLIKALCGHAIIYHTHQTPRNNAGFPTRGEYPSQTAKDAAMTAASDYDIAWVRPGREKSGTARNLERRKKRNEEFL